MKVSAIPPIHSGCPWWQARWSPVAQGRGQIGIRIIGTQGVLVPWLVASLPDFPPFVRKFRLYIYTLRSYNGYSYKGYLVEY